MCTCMVEKISAYMYASTYVRTYVCMCVRVYVCVCVCVYVARYVWPLT